MNHKISIFDNFFTPRELKEYTDEMNNLTWVFGARSKSGEGYKFWSSKLESKSIIDTSLKRIHKNINYTKTFSLLRVHANGQTYGQDGNFHTDDHRSDCYTLLIYMSDTDGYTQFKIDDQVVNIEPLKNRAILFKSNILHRGLAPSRDSSILRISIAFKMQIKGKNL